MMLNYTRYRRLPSSDGSRHASHLRREIAKLADVIENLERWGMPTESTRERMEHLKANLAEAEARCT